MNWTDPDYAASGIDESNRLFSASVKQFPDSQHQIPCSTIINSLFSPKAFPASRSREYQRKFLNLTLRLSLLAPANTPEKSIVFSVNFPVSRENALTRGSQKQATSIEHPSY
jgi:hypothetical protein